MINIHTLCRILVTLPLTTRRAAAGALKPPLISSFQFQKQTHFYVLHQNLSLVLAMTPASPQLQIGKQGHRALRFCFHGGFKSAQQMQIRRNAGVSKGTRLLSDFPVSKPPPPLALGPASPAAAEGSLHGTTFYNSSNPKERKLLLCLYECAETKPKTLNCFQPSRLVLLCTPGNSPSSSQDFSFQFVWKTGQIQPKCKNFQLRAWKDGLKGSVHTIVLKHFCRWSGDHSSN